MYLLLNTGSLFLCSLIAGSCPRAIPPLLQSISRSRWPTCGRHKSVRLLLAPHSSFVLFLTLCCLELMSPIGRAVSEAKCGCVSSSTQANWEKRVLKSLNSMSTELEVPLARKVSQILSVLVLD